MSMRPRIPAKRSICIAIALAIAALPSLSSAKSCIDWQRLMAQYELSLLPEGKAVLITPFSNFTKKSEDDWLVKGIRDYIADLMRSSKKLRVLSGTAATHGQVMSPEWKVSGRFQRDGSDLRIFVSLAEGASGKLLKQLELRFPYPGNKEFFERIEQATRDLMKEMDSKYDSGTMRKVSDATASTAAFESYSKGRQILEDYNPKTAPGAESHFKDAVRLDNRFLESNAAFMEALYASKLGNLEGAADALRRCVDLVPEDAVAWHHLARVYSQIGDVTRSGEALRKANEIDPCGG